MLPDLTRDQFEKVPQEMKSDGLFHSAGRAHGARWFPSVKRDNSKPQGLLLLVLKNAKKTQKKRKEPYNILLSKGIFARHFLRQRIKGRKASKVKS